MSRTEQKKPFVIWLIVTSLTTWSLLACAWIKTEQRQMNTAMIFIILCCIVNVVAYVAHRYLARKYTIQ